MNTKQLMLAALAGTALQTAQAQQQFWNSLPGGNVITNNEWMGADLLSTIPLSFETRVNQPMQWRTNNVLRMRLHETLPAQTIGIYTNENLSGNLGIGAFTTANVPRPFSLLHLDNGGNQFSGYRSWHRPGADDHERDRSGLDHQAGHFAVGAPSRS